jgi:hypothetical protein
MTIKEAIPELKESIKSLTAAQIQDKKVLRQPHTSDTWEVMMRAWNRSCEITLFLNLYNELRGKPYQHSTKKFDHYLISIRSKQLEKYQELLEVNAV